MIRQNSFLLAAFASLVASGVLLTGQQPAAGPFTAEQAAAGKTAYEASCAACHGSDLMGAPPLAGEGFIGGWRTRTTRDMYRPHSYDDARGQPRWIARDHLRRTSCRTSFNTTASPPVRAAHADDGRQDWWSRAWRRCPGARRGSARRRSTSAGRTWRRCAGCSGRRWTRTRSGTAAHGTHRERRGEELRARHRRDAAQSRPRVTGRCCARSVRIELQPAHASHARQRAGSAASVDLADERGRNESTLTARLQRDHLPQQHRRHRPGARRQDR